MSILNELTVLFESARGKKERKQAELKASKLKGQEKIAKELGFDFEEGKGIEDYLTDLSHWKALIKKKDNLTDGGGYQSVMAGLTTMANSFKDPESLNQDKTMANKIKTLQDKIRKYYKK